MPFPLPLEDSTCASARDLAAVLASDARSSAAPRPWERVLAWVASGRLARVEAVGLTAAFLQQADAALLCEGARMAARLGEPRLGALALDAVDGHDPAVLLGADPLDPSRSAEDALLAAAAVAIDPTDAALRGRLLERLRHAGLPEIEAPLLLAHGSAEEIARWLPAVLAEGLSDTHRTLALARIARGDPGARAVRAALDGF